MIRVLLVAGRADFREPLAFLLRRQLGLAVVGQAGSAAEARRKLAAGLRADVAVVELGLPDGDGAELIGELRAAGRARAVLALAGGDDPAARARALAAGAAVVVPASAPLAALREAVRRVGAGP
jgi:DNA-binding NarL/FixJ family response regulator